MIAALLKAIWGVPCNLTKGRVIERQQSPHTSLRHMIWHLIVPWPPFVIALIVLLLRPSLHQSGPLAPFASGMFENLGLHD